MNGAIGRRWCLALAGALLSLAACAQPAANFTTPEYSPSFAPEQQAPASAFSFSPFASPEPTGSPSDVQLSNNDYYTNSSGNRVHDPAYSSGGVPPGATAQCRDGTYSFSQHRQGTCSHHGGVARWL